MTKDKHRAPRGATLLPQPKVRKALVFPKVVLPRVGLVWWLLLVVVLVFLVSGRVGYNVWPVTKISISGPLHSYHSEQLEEQLQWVLQESFFSLDVDKVREQLLGLPLLMPVTVNKRWPGVLSVVVREEIPIALWNQSQLLTANGGLSEIPMNFSVDHLIALQGPEQQVQNATLYFRRLQQMLHSHGVHIVQFKITPVASIQADLSNGWQVKFGRQYYEQRMARLKKLLVNIPAEKISTIDLRYGKGAAIQWRNIGETNS